MSGWVGGRVGGGALALGPQFTDPAVTRRLRLQVTSMLGFKLTRT